LIPRGSLNVRDKPRATGKEGMEYLPALQQVALYRSPKTSIHSGQICYEPRRSEGITQIEGIANCCILTFSTIQRRLTGASQQLLFAHDGDILELFLVDFAISNGVVLVLNLSGGISAMDRSNRQTVHVVYCNIGPFALSVSHRESDGRSVVDDEESVKDCM
jgi:hypothetical protein